MMPPLTFHEIAAELGDMTELIAACWESEHLNRQTALEDIEGRLYALRDRIEEVLS